MADFESIAALEGITASLRRQRQDLQNALEKSFAAARRKRSGFSRTG